MKESELLFPSETGEFRACSCPDKPFDEVVTALKLKKKITPRAMRRTFQDLARAAEVKDVVTRAVSGHATEAMQRHYSTVSAAEMRTSLTDAHSPSEPATGRKRASSDAGSSTFPNPVRPSSIDTPAGCAALPATCAQESTGADRVVGALSRAALDWTARHDVKQLRSALLRLIEELLPQNWTPPLRWTEPA